MAKNKEKQARQAIIVDMNDFLMDYAAVKLGRQPDLAHKVAAAGQPDLTGLDQLFGDNGVGRRTKYLDIALGFLHDENDTGDQTSDEVAAGEQLAQEAIAYLGNHTQEFDRWEEA